MPRDRSDTHCTTSLKRPSYKRWEKGEKVGNGEWNVEGLHITKRAERDYIDEPLAILKLLMKL